MRLELINTGTELLLGSVVNTHLAWLGAQLLPLGLRIERQLCVPDGEVIRGALIETVGRADIVLVTGGLGPTSDDVTREITADLLGLPLEEDADVLAAITAHLAARQREVNDHTRRQAMVPRGATILTNPRGTAPGLYFRPLPQRDSGGRKCPHLFLLPGPPRELQPMFTNLVVPLLSEITGGDRPVKQMKNFRLCGLGETQVSTTVEEPLMALGDIELGYCARPGEVTVRVIGSTEQLAAAESILAAAFPAAFFSSDDQPMEHVVVDLLTRMGRKVSLAESCTGGCTAHGLTNVPGASAVLDCSFVTYANEAKSALLGVPARLIEMHGAVSPEVAAAMAAGCLGRSGADYALAITGIAGPAGGTLEKPVGTVFIALASKDHVGAPPSPGGPAMLIPPLVEHEFFPWERETFKLAASQAALDLLRRRLIRMV